MVLFPAYRLNVPGGHLRGADAFPGQLRAKTYQLCGGKHTFLAFFEETTGKERTSCPKGTPNKTGGRSISLPDTDLSQG